MATRPGLRERKRLEAMRRIQTVALDLFDRYGFDHVTIEQIADAADVSPSSVYRYFGTKEHVVLWDEMDVRLLDVVETALASGPPTEALRRAISDVMAQLFDRDEALTHRKTRYILEEPGLRAAVLEQTDAFTRRVAEGLARAAGRSADDLEPQVVASALVWSLMAAVRHWHANGYREPLLAELNRALAIVERGL